MTDEQGFTLVEIILAVLILSIAIAPMVLAFAKAPASSLFEEQTVIFTNQARGTLNRVVGMDFDTLYDNQGNPVDLVSLFGSAGEASKENFSFRGKSYTPALVIADASGGAGGLLELTVTIDSVSLKILKAKY